MKRLEFSDEEQLFPPLTILLLLLLLILLSSIIGAALILLMYYGQAQSFESLLANLQPDSPSGDRNKIRWSLLLNHLTTFVIPPLALALFLFRQRWAAFLQLLPRPDWTNLGLGSTVIIAAIPLVQFTYWLNRQIPLPQWAQSMESTTNDLINNLLISAHPYELFFNLLVIAILPALGEELVFRGVLQKQLGRFWRNPHLAIWVSALIFSAFHLQFEGFLPRMILGAMLGYLLYWSKSLWVPIFAHFVNNGLQIVAQYFYQQELSTFNPDQQDEVHWGLSIFSFILVALLSYRLYWYNQEKTKLSDETAAIEE